MQVEPSRDMVECSRVTYNQVDPFLSVLRSSRAIVECSRVKYRAMVECSRVK